MRASLSCSILFSLAVTGASEAHNSAKNELQSELHWSVSASSSKEIIDQLGLKLKGREERDTSYFDERGNGTFENYSRGIALRLRSKLDSLKKSSTVKIRVNSRDELIDYDVDDASEKYKCEEDRYNDHASLVCSLTRGFFGSALENCAKFFSESQNIFLRKNGSIKIDWAKQKQLGPVRDLVWTFDFGGDRELELETMRLPNDTELYELSLRVNFNGAAARMRDIEQWILGRGITLATKQESKTRQILEYFSTPSQ